MLEDIIMLKTASYKDVCVYKPQNQYELRKFKKSCFLTPTCEPWQLCFDVL